MNLPNPGLAKILLACVSFFFPFILFAQDIPVRGIVLNAADGRPVSNATITRTDGTRNNATMSDVNGAFSLAAPNGGKLLISSIGFEEQTITTGPELITIRLHAESKQLNDVVVTALGVKKDKKIIGYSTQEVKGRDLIKAREPNPVNSLVGKVAGLTVGASAELLGTPQVLLRGGNISLYVVDGIPINSDLPL